MRAAEPVWSGVPRRSLWEPLFSAFSAGMVRHYSPDSRVPLLLWSGSAPQQEPVSFPPCVVERPDPHGAPRLPRIASHDRVVEHQRSTTPSPHGVVEHGDISRLEARPPASPREVAPSPAAPPWRQKSRTVGSFSRIRDAEKDSASQIPDDAARFPNPGRWGRRSGVRNPGRGRLSSGLLASGRIYRRVSSCRWWKWRHPLGEGVESRRLPARGHPPALRDNSRQQEEDGRCGSCAPPPADGRGDTRARAVWGIRTKM